MNPINSMNKLLSSILILISLAVINAQVTVVNNCPDEITVFSGVPDIYPYINPYKDGKVFASGQKESLSVMTDHFWDGHFYANEDKTKAFITISHDKVFFVGEVIDGFNLPLRIETDLCDAKVTCLGVPSEDCANKIIPEILDKTHYCYPDAQVTVTFCPNKDEVKSKFLGF